MIFIITFFCSCSYYDVKYPCNMDVYFDSNVGETMTINLKNLDNILHKNITIINYLPEHIEYIHSSIPTSFHIKNEKILNIGWKIKEILPNECIKIALKVKAKPDSSIDKIIQVFKDCESVFIKKSQHYFYFIAPKISIVVKKYVSNVENEMAEEDSSDIYKIGQPIAYNITVYNSFKKPFTNISVQNCISNSMMLISAEGPSRCNIKGKIVEFSSIEILDSGESLDYKIICVPISSGKIDNITSINYDRSKKRIQKSTITTIQ